MSLLFVATVRKMAEVHDAVTGLQRDCPAVDPAQGAIPLQFDQITKDVRLGGLEPGAKFLGVH
jgi:hypothetical protein